MHRNECIRMASILCQQRTLLLLCNSPSKRLLAMQRWLSAKNSHTYWRTWSRDRRFSTKHDLQLGPQQLVGSHTAGNNQVADSRLRVEGPGGCTPRALLQMRQRHPLK